jgi:hypothetical protein
MRRLFLVGGLCGCLLHADFAYEQSSKVTGGMMAGMMKVAGVFSSKARQPMKATVLVKGDRMAVVSPDSMQVIDLNKETMTMIDLDKKNYSVITFAEMTQAMTKAAEKAGQQKQGDVEMSMKVDVKDTGQSRVVSGFNAKQMIMTIDLEAANKQNRNESGALRVTNDMWITPKIAGYDEVQNFYKKMAAKLAWSPGGGMLGGMAAARPDLAKGLAKAAEEASKVDGIPVLTITKMGAAVEGAAAAQPSQPPPPQQPAASSSESGAGAALGRLGKLGGLGGFGRKKKDAEQQPAEAAPQQASGDPAGALMVMESELSSFSSAPIDGSRFDVPAGFKEVEHPMKRQLR